MTYKSLHLIKLELYYIEPVQGPNIGSTPPDKLHEDSNCQSEAEIAGLGHRISGLELMRQNRARSILHQRQWGFGQ